MNESEGRYSATRKERDLLRWYILLLRVIELKFAHFIFRHEMLKSPDVEISSTTSKKFDYF